MLWLLLLLALSSASLQETVKDASPDVSSLSPNQEDAVPKMVIKSIETIHRLLPSTESRQERQLPSSSSVFDKESKLRWVEWEGSLPKGAVSVYNTKKERLEYVCSVRCELGYYNPNEGDMCFYSYDKRQRSHKPTHILVNEDNFEMLEWRKSSDVSDSLDLVRICVEFESYVGKNDYGLGKVDPKEKRLYYGLEGKEHWTSSYKVLTINEDAESQGVSDVKYEIDQGKIEKNPTPTVMKTSIITNKQCAEVSKTATLSKTTRNEKRWDISASLKLGVTTTISAGVPSITSGSVEVGLETSFESSGGNSVSEEVTHSETIEFKVPPNHSCKVQMLGRKFTADIPFTAHLKRTYKNGQIKSTVVTGKYHGVQIGEIHVELQRCTTIDGVNPCFKKI
ncbi:natterin-3-like [Odontesthes bonariensis]|uniref:natterin-3-like n=1 Tax=Odontesthes bonariensis TaxID=219752 RepID=UPI003F58ECDE